MAIEKSYHLVAAARVRAATQIQETPDLLARYVDLGGLTSDLESIREVGHQIEALGTADSLAAEGDAARDAATALHALQREYSAVLAVLHAVRGDLQLKNASPDVVKRIDDVIANEVASPAAIAPAAGAAPASAAKGKAPALRRPVTKEGLRGEIEKDAAALLDFKEIHEALQNRKVPPARLEKLKKAAQALAGKLAEKTGKKPAVKTVSPVEQDLIARHRERWRSCSRLLVALGRKDERARMLVLEGTA